LPLVANTVLVGVVPAAFILRYRLQPRRLSRAIFDRCVAVAVACGMIAIPLYVSQKEILSLGRNHREVRYMIGPFNILAASYSVIRDRLQAPTEFRSVALDAARTSETTGDRRPSVHVLIVGETARAANFSMAGYSRMTNPMLHDRPDVNFFNISSCGTATAVSLPCMFTIESRAKFDRVASSNEDNLLDIAARAGYSVHWVDNGNGCKGLCARVDNRDVHEAKVDSLCTSDGCFDAILVHELEMLLPEIKDDTLIVLHQLGSHGPAYYRRYPDEFRAFVPDCRSPNLGDCSNQAIANSYDNTILYTDYVVATAIEALSEYSGRLNTSLIYLSDHGESLGEHNLYLHGMPYKFAPREQTQVPMISWFSPGAEQLQAFQPGCRNRIGDTAVSHDNLFHTELGLLGIETVAYQSDLDIFAACRKPERMTAAVWR